MKLEEIGQREQKQRIVQELVPGKQITLAHIIANPDGELYEKLGLDPRVELSRAAIGIMTVSPSETAIIMADIAVKSSGVALGFVDLLHPSIFIASVCIVFMGLAMTVGTAALSHLTQKAAEMQAENDLVI